MILRLLKRWLPILSIIVPVGLFFWRLLLPHPQLIITPDFGQSDAVTSFSTKFFYGQELQKGHIPLWTSQMGGGYPIYGNGGMATWFLPNLLFFYFFPAPVGYIFVLISALVLMGLGTYWWLRLLGSSRTASVFGAVTIALSGYSIAQLTHLNIIESISVFPLLGAMTCILATRRSWAMTVAFSFCIAQLIVIGFAQSIVITALFLLCYFIWQIRGKRDWIVLSLNFIAGGVLGILLSAIQLLPSMEYLSQLDSSGSFANGGSTTFSFPWSHLITVFHPFALGNPAIGTYPHFVAFGGSIFWENMNYIGILPILFIVLAGFRQLSGVFRNKSSAEHLPHAQFFAGALIVSLFLMTGSHSPFYFVFSFWPFTLFRVPSRFVWIFSFSITVLGAFAFQSVLSLVKTKRLAMLVAVFCIVLQVMNSYLIWSPYHNIEPAKEWLSPPSFLEFLDRSGYTKSIGAELQYNSTYAGRGWSRTDPKDRPSYILRNTFTPDKNMLWNVPQVSEYAGRSLRRARVLNDLLSQSITTDQGNATVSAIGTKLLSLLAVHNVISTLELHATGLISRAQLNDPGHRITLFTNPDSVPLAYMAQDTVLVHTVDDAVRAFSADSFIPGKTILVETAQPEFVVQTPVPVQMLKREEGHFALRITGLQKPGILVLVQNFYPGWTARIDGKPQTVFPVNVSHIGISVPPGDHTVDFRFSPESYRRGRLITVFTLLVIVCAGVFARVRAIFYTPQKASQISQGPRHSRDTS